MTADHDEAAETFPPLGDFVLRRKLGQGGMGTVYLGRQVSLDRDCAVKILSRDMAAKPGFVDRFLREARAMARIDHPHVVSCYAVGQENGQHFVAMEFIDGRSMQDWINELQQIPVPDALLVTILCGEALQHAHDMNMVHRDVKPDNILVTSRGDVKISDMGLAKAIDESDLSLTQTGTGLGTPHYMAPEQARNAKHVDQRGDIYSLGCTLYHFVTGKTPFDGLSLIQLITNKEKGQFTPAHRLNPQVPERLSLMIDKSMAADPKARYQSCTEFVADLETLGLVGESLSFIPSPQRMVLRKVVSAAPATSRAAPTMSAPTPATAPVESRPARKLTEEERQQDGRWFVRHEVTRGKVQITKMTTAQILKSIREDSFTERTQISMQPQGPFHPLAQLPIFEEETRKMLTRRQAQARNTDLAAQYKELESQFEQEHLWQVFQDLSNSLLGLINLALWVAVGVAAVATAYTFIPSLFTWLAQRVGLGA